MLIAYHAVDYGEDLAVVFGYQCAKGFGISCLRSPGELPVSRLL